MSRKKKVGLSPGSLIYTGEAKKETPVLSGLKYNSQQLLEIHQNQCLHINFENGFHYWLDLKGIHDVNLIANIGERFGIHRLILEDILDPGQRVKIEDYDSAIFAIIHHVEYNKINKEFIKEQIAIYCTKHLLISFQENPDDTFAIIRDRMHMDLSRIRNRNSDYLFYAIIDYVVDKYYLVVEAFHDEIEILEDRVLREDLDLKLDELHVLRNHIISLKRYIFPLREEVSKIKKLESNLIDEATFIFLRDLQDNIQHLIESLDNQRELLNGLRELILSKANLNMNKDMKWLTVVSTISIPILFFTGVYGMNFENMPELKWKYGYLTWWIGITIVVIGMIAFLKKKKLF
ncbi:MAG: magnesium/cobalt transporter CorA [Saprospiraceae bacterium]|nr:magnesium/cobalt transporter CorA [Saprospiraceae bacterium]MBK8484962.1 magnesium/cobalt transporter CorA [Saprospiraceae bacterium]MBK9223228.1 magnesium/cobalt transporter CorA [Saprospiraceae bacterium]MBK9720758.1 magnesium/cobalt transporter CorA [Saprospiraceae bacterium]MBK9727746.1 magnesium/cobalt transporter CorA [Saprospiraceae bacterium]